MDISKTIKFLHVTTAAQQPHNYSHLTSKVKSPITARRDKIFHIASVSAWSRTQGHANRVVLSATGWLTELEPTADAGTTIN